MEVGEKPICQFGAKCYRKNPIHFQNYSHPTKSPDGSSKTPSKRVPSARKAKLNKTFKESDTKKKGPSKMKQTTLEFARKFDCTKTVSPVKKNEKESTKGKVLPAKEKTSRSKNEQLKRTRTRSQMSSEEIDFKSSKNEISKNKKKKPDEEDIKKNKDNNDTFENSVNSETSLCGNTTSDSGTMLSNSWVFIKKPSSKMDEDSDTEEFKGKSVEESIKALFLVDMPKDFYSFFEFCKSIDKNNPSEALQVCGLKLVGPFDVLLDEINNSVDKELCLCHWRLYYDPPEFQTVLALNSGFHIGYWRDDPKELPVFMASNNANKDCIFKVEAENIFGTVLLYLGEHIKTCDPFTKIKITKLQSSLIDWAVKNEFSVEKKSSKITARQKKIVSKTFHRVGIVVPVDDKTDVGYRPLIETEANLKKMCKLVMQADDENEREALWENLQPLITAANIANDECDFGNSLELGIDLFCMGSTIFHDTVEHLLTTAYSLLNRIEFETIIKAHLKNRKKDLKFSWPISVAI